MYDSIEMGEYLMLCASRKCLFINQTKLQKLLYILYGSYLAVHKNILLLESPKAWPYGPVFPRAQKKFAKMGDLNKLDKSVFDFEHIKIDSDVNSLIDAILDTFGNWSAKDLSAWSHKPGSPWAIALTNNAMRYNAPIENADILAYFQSIMNLDNKEDE